MGDKHTPDIKPKPKVKTRKDNLFGEEMKVEQHLKQRIIEFLIGNEKEALRHLSHH